MNKKDLTEIIFYARGGQGAKSAAEIVAQAAVKEGKFVQAFPSFGPERSGAPTKTYLRISKKEIRTHEPVVNPDIEIVLDETILELEKKTAAVVIINSSKKEADLKKTLENNKNIYTADANKISMEIIGQARPNTVILGKFVAIAGLVKIESVIEEFKRIFEGKIGKESTAKNIEAIRKAYYSKK